MGGSQSARGCVLSRRSHSAFPPGLEDVLKVRIVGKGKRRIVRLTATKDGDSKKLMSLIEALAAPAILKEPYGKV